jgi:hypothetical protein
LYVNCTKRKEINPGLNFSFWFCLLSYFLSLSPTEICAHFSGAVREVQSSPVKRRQCSQPALERVAACFPALPTKEMESPRQWSHSFPG